jgi:hypothetical protein
MGSQKLLKWFVEENHQGKLKEQFQITWNRDNKGEISRQDYTGNSKPPDFTLTMLDFLTEEGFLVSTRKYGTYQTVEDTLPGITNGPQVAVSRDCPSRKHEAENSGFNLPDH